MAVHGPIEAAAFGRKLPEVSVVVPVYNEAGNIHALLARLIPVLQDTAPHFEIVFVDDGSTDETAQVIRDAARLDWRVRALRLSRNFGKEMAIAAGLDHARGHAIVLMDADLQDPPEAIEAFVSFWRQGYDVVYADQPGAASATPIHRVARRLFYSLFRTTADVSMHRNAGDFRLMSRRVVQALGRLNERARFTKGLYAWVGFKTIGIRVAKAERHSGHSQWPTARLINFAIDGLTSFSSLPLRMISVFGLVISFLAIVYGLFIAASTLLFGNDVPGFPSLFVSSLLLSGLQLLSIGVIGEYVGRIFIEVKQRPLYLVEEEIFSGQTSEGAFEGSMTASRTG